MPTTYETPKPLPDNRVREFTDTPGDRFWFDPGDIAEYRGERGTVESVDTSTRQLRLQGWERTAFVSWERCRLVQTVAEQIEQAATATTEPAVDDVTAAAPKTKAAK